nr:uncharacterized protein LOC105340770 isoform X2 [Crassostrea gigas]
MDCRLQCIGVILLLVVLATHAFLEDYSPINKRRSKRAIVETSECKKEIENDGMDLINYGMEVLTKGAVKKNQCSFVDSLKSVFDFLQQHRNDIKQRIAEALKKRYRTGYQTLIKKAKDLSKLEDTLVYMYTDDDIYGDLNFALSQHKCTKKTLEQKDKELAPYAAALFATLLYWEKLPGYKGKTYRMIGNVRGDMTSALKSYQKGKSVVFPAFTSSTNLINAAFNFIGHSTDNNILLIIDNSTPSLWRPKDIQKYSKYPTEREFLYPSVAEFQILSNPVKKVYVKGTSYYEIRLQLVGQKRKEGLLQKLRRFCRI